MIHKRRLLWQLYPSYLLIILLSIIATTWFSSRTLKTFAIEHNISNLKTLARVLESQITAHMSPPDQAYLDQLCKKSGITGEMRITVILASGIVIGDSEEDPEKMDRHTDRPEVAQAFLGETGISTRYSLTLNQNMVYVAIPLKTKTSIAGVLRISTPLTSIDETVGVIQTKILISGILISILATVICLIVSRRITRPIEEIKQHAECFARGDFECKLPSFESEEIGSLSATMNQMATELSERIQTITLQRNELKVVFSSMVEGVLAVDADEHIINMNEAASRFFQCDPTTTQGKSVQEVIRNVELQKFVKEVLAGHKLIEQDINFHDHPERILNGHGTPLYNTDGRKGNGALIVLNDVTRLRQLETMRRDFVANVSHEIKTPITAIKGFVQTLNDGAADEPENRKRFLEIIEKHVDRLSKIIDDLLSLSRVEEDTNSGEIVLMPGMIRDVLSTAVQLCETKAVAKNITLELNCDSGLEADINPLLLEQAVVNLLDNAIKYSDEEGAVRLLAKTQREEIVIEVQDDGCGIEKKHLDRLFERFYRVDKARSRRLGGTGLGLAIVKHIAQAHQGYVSVNSTPFEGSTFGLHLPRRSSPSPK